MWLAARRKVKAGSPGPRPKPARRNPRVEQLEDRRAPAIGLVTWAEGTMAPPDLAIPLSPAPLSVVFLALTGPTYSNSCFAEAAHGGRPDLAMDETARTIDLVFQPPAPTACPLIYRPVSGFVGGLFFLGPGNWTLHGLPGSEVTFTVVSQPIALPFETVERGPFSSYHYGDPAFHGEDLVIQDRATWQRFWRQHRAGTTPPPPVPAIDFEREIVLVTLMGNQTSSGPHTTINEVVYNPEDGTLTVRVTDHREPGPLPVVTNPFHIVRVPRLPYSAIVFEHRDA